jgi:uncharacterized protein YceH (UPF0502 family)
MIELTPNEARALGVLIEKAFTTPEQYPLSLNALTNGCNQKNNRDPVLSLSEDEVHDAAEALREKQLAVRVDQMGSRVHKYRHQAGDVLRCKSGELAILAELLMRGPQTLGELRGRASRMHPLATLEDAQTMLRGLMEQEEPLVRQVPPLPGSRAERYAQLLSPDAHPLAESAAGATGATATPSANSPASAGGGAGLSDRVLQLEQQVASLTTARQKLAASIGEPDPTADMMSQSPPPQSQPPAPEPQNLAAESE